MKPFSVTQHRHGHRGRHAELAGWPPAGAWWCGTARRGSVGRAPDSADEDRVGRVPERVRQALGAGAVEVDRPPFFSLSRPSSLKIVNAFWQGKGAVTAKEFHQYNSEVTPLIRFPKAVYTSSETFVAQAELANYYKPLEAIVDDVNKKQKVLKASSFGNHNYSLGGCLPVGQLELDLRQFSSAKKSRPSKYCLREPTIKTSGIFGSYLLSPAIKMAMF